MEVNIIETWRKEFDEFLTEKKHRMSNREVVARALETEKKILAEYKRHTKNT